MNFYTFFVFVTIPIYAQRNSNNNQYTYCTVYLMTINRTKLSMNDNFVFIR